MNIKKDKVVCFVPIKLESKRIERKNLKRLNGKPLYNYVLETLSSVKNIDKTYVFCSDEKFNNNLPDNVEFLKRDKILDNDDTLGKDIYDAFTSIIDADVYVLAHTTAPFLKSTSIEISVDKVLNGNYDSSLSVYQNKTFAWYKNKPINYSTNLVPKTQDLEPIYTETSGFYVFTKELWINEKKRVGKNPYKFLVNNIEAVDIDDENDFNLAEIIAKNSDV